MYDNILVEMLDPFYNYIIVCLAIYWSFDYPIRKEVVFYVLKGKVVDVLYDQKWRHYKTVVAYVFDCYNPFLIIRLNFFISVISINIHNHYIVINDIYYKVYFVEVVKVVVLDIVLRIYIGYKLKPYVYKVWIFVESSLEIVRIR